jgi:hypothetical protein
MITRLKLSTIEQGLPKYRSMLAGNAAYVPSSYESIASATGTGSSGTITFSTISSSYQSLQIRGVFNVSSGSDYLLLRFNSDSSASYTTHSLLGDGANPSTLSLTGRTSIFTCPATGSVQQTNPGTVLIDIHNYTSTTQNKTVKIFGGVDKNGSGSIDLTSGLYINTSAISSISLILQNGGTFTTSSQFALYGIKGA